MDDFKLFHTRIKTINYKTTELFKNYKFCRFQRRLFKTNNCNNLQLMNFQMFTTTSIEKLEQENKFLNN